MLLFRDIYFADERLVPFDSPESNFGLVKRKLLDQLPPDGPHPHVFHINEKLIDDAQEAADDYEKVLIRGFANKDSVKLPMFDLLLLGCAPDGHICSLFPNHPLLREEYAWVAPVEDAPKPPPRRITLTLPVITHSHRVTFVVEGSTKAPVIKTIMERPEKGLPSSLVNEAAAGKVSWFVDDAALYGVYATKKAYKIQVPLTGEPAPSTSTSAATSAVPSEAPSNVNSPVLLQVDAKQKEEATVSKKEEETLEEPTSTPEINSEAEEKKEEVKQPKEEEQPKEEKGVSIDSNPSEIIET